MFNFHKFISTNSALVWYNPWSKYQQKILNSELKAILNTMDRFIDFFEKWLPDHSIKKDVLTDKPLGDLDEILNEDFKKRQEEVKWEITRLAKVATGQDWQAQENTHDTEPQIDTWL